MHLCLFLVYQPTAYENLRVDGMEEASLHVVLCSSQLAANVSAFLVLRTSSAAESHSMAGSKQRPVRATLRSRQLLPFDLANKTLPEHSAGLATVGNWVGSGVAKRSDVKYCWTGVFSIVVGLDTSGGLIDPDWLTRSKKSLLVGEGFTSFGVEYALLFFDEEYEAELRERHGSERAEAAGVTAGAAATGAILGAAISLA